MICRDCHSTLGDDARDWGGYCPPCWWVEQMDDRIRWVRHEFRPLLVACGPDELLSRLYSGDIVP